MLIKISCFEDIDQRQLMDLYQEGNRENCSYFFPDEEEAAALPKVEQKFLDYLEQDFFSAPDRWYYVLEKKGVWVSALRLSHIRDDIYYIEALETHPGHRKKGYAVEFMQELIDTLKEKGPFRLCDCVSKKNEASLATHKKCGFEIVSEEGYDYLSGEVNDRCYGLQYTFSKR